VKLSGGLIFSAPGFTGDIDHPCILLTDDFNADEQVVVNLTDFRHIMGARVDIPSGTALSKAFTTSKRSTIHFAYATRIGTEVLEGTLDYIESVTMGNCDLKWLDLFRVELFESDDTPPRVVAFCEPLDWGT
jgi:hypothetical protein